MPTDEISEQEFTSINDFVKYTIKIDQKCRQIKPGSNVLFFEFIKNQMGVCPVSIISAESVFYVRLYAKCNKYNALPKSGGVIEQDAYTMRCLDIIDNEISRMQKREEQKIKKESQIQKNTGQVSKIVK